MLLLYLFIATPVALWHDHGNDTEKSETQSSKTVLAADCKICAHQYAPGLILELETVAGIKHIYAFPKTVNVYFLPWAVVLTQSNKGPPTC